MATAEREEAKYDDLYASQASGDEEELVAGDLGDKQSLIQSNKEASIERVPLRDATFHQETICGFDGLKVIVISAVMFALAITIGLIVTIIIGDPQVKPHGAVASSNQHCSDVGKNIMQNKGGSGVDAALACMICLGVINGHQSGLGGGGFLMVRQGKEESVAAFDFRETAPSASTADMFAGKPEADRKGGLAVAVPGELAGMKRVHEIHGRVSWSDLFQPSIALARDGFEIPGALANSLAKIPLEDMNVRMKDIYAPNGLKVKAGDYIARPKYATLLESIADQGIDSFYRGAIADDIINTITSSGGIMLKSDLSAYTVDTPPTISVQYQGVQINALPAPSGGPLVLSAMNILNTYNNRNSTEEDVEVETTVTPSLLYHRLIETFKFVTAMGSSLGDPAFNEDMQNITNEMLSPSRADHIRGLITDNTTHDSSYYLDSQGNLLESFGTSQVSVIDNDNNMVTVTTTVNNAFGSLLMTEHGIILNNEMADFNWDGKSTGNTQANYIEPGKRPQSHMAPIISWNVTNVCVRKLALGGTNGSRIWTGVTQTLHQLLGSKSTLDEVIRPMTRVHTPLIPNQVEAEDELSEEIKAGLIERGHKIVVNSQGLSSVSAVMKENDKLYTYGDNRTIGAGGSQF